jgi:hypothetical protein
MEALNTIALVPATHGKRTYLEIEVDGVPLAHHFASRTGAHPSHLSPLGWSSASAGVKARITEQLLAKEPSELESGRVPVLVCEECGDVGCGAYTVLILRDGDTVRWMDWAYENGREPAQPLEEWPTRPGDFLFELGSYERAIRKASARKRWGMKWNAKPQ